MDNQISLREVLLQAFPGIEQNQADEIISSGEIQNHLPGKTLCLEGEFENTFYVILSGEVQVSKQLNNDQKRTLKHLGPGSFFGEMAIIHNAPRAATVSTTQPTSVLAVRKESFTGLLERSKSVSLAVIREVSRRLRENDEMAIEDLRLKAKELALAYQQLAEEEFARSQFLTTVAHELRTPMMAANGYVQAIRMGMLQGEALNSAMETVWRNLQEITSLTNDILFLQEMDLIPAEFRPTDITGVILKAIEQENGLAERTGVAVAFQAKPGLPPVLADSKSLQRAIAAIINNAIKFSPDGGQVQVRVEGNSEEIIISIEDHGVGIPPESMPRIFQRFFHLDVIAGRVFRGIGLGLSIARQVIEQHHGTIEVQSELEKGSLFTIRLSLA